VALSPPYSERTKIPHQPTPSLGRGFHWPVDCAEVFSHPWLRVFQCPECKQGHERLKDEMLKGGLVCHGNGSVEVEDEL